MGESIRELPEIARPYEKLLAGGADALDDSELLAVLLRSGTRGMNSVALARRILNEAGGSLSGLGRLSSAQLLKIPGIGKVKSLEIQAIVKLSERMQKSVRGALPDFSTPSGAADYFMEEMRILRQEVLKVIFLNNKCGMTGEKTVAVGSVNAAMFPVREILVEALRAEAVRIILIHNHPSGDPTPSGEDIRATLTVRQTANAAGIPLEDHIIIGDRRYVSLREQGYLS